MKSLKNVLRLWIGFTSVFGFFGAWAMLAQSFTPTLTQPSPAAVYPTLTALAPISVYAAAQPNVNLQVVVPTPMPLPTPQPQPIYMPSMFTTGGS